MRADLELESLAVAQVERIGQLPADSLLGSRAQGLKGITDTRPHLGFAHQ